MPLCKFTSSEGGPVWINPHLIVRIAPDKDYTRITLADGGVKDLHAKVIEKPETVVQIVNDALFSKSKS